MARLTFKQFIKEADDFLADPMELIPKRKLDVFDAQGKKVGEEDNPEYEKQREKDFMNFTRSSRLQTKLVKPEETEGLGKLEKELSVVKSGGSGKLSTLQGIGRFKKNIDFLGTFGHFYPGPELQQQIFAPVSGRR